MAASLLPSSTRISSTIPPVDRRVACHYGAALKLPLSRFPSSSRAHLPPTIVARAAGPDGSTPADASQSSSTNGPNSTSSSATPLSLLSSSSSSPPSPPPSSSSSSPSRDPLETSLEGIMAFDGAAPEIVNGRLAMVGFLSALSSELSHGSSLQAQLTDPAEYGLVLMGIAAAAVTAASLPPMMQGVRQEDTKFLFFTPQAEMLNGRAAMMGLVALWVLEELASFFV